MSPVRHPILLGALILAVACTSPDAIPIEEERALGAEIARAAEAQLPMLPDPVVRGFVEELGDRLVANADTTGRDYRFYVIDSPVANAFAAPGGYIFINRGILERSDDLSELAGVMAHEVGHVVERHSLEQMSKAQNANILVALVYALLNRSPGAGEQVAIQVAGSAWMAKHGREAEEAADAVGLTYMALAGIDPRGMPRFFRKLLSEESSQSPMVLQWFSTHPLTAERIAATEAFIAERLAARVVEEGVRDVPEFQLIKRRLAALPPPPPDPTSPSPAP